MRRSDNRVGTAFSVGAAAAVGWARAAVLILQVSLTSRIRRLLTTWPRVAPVELAGPPCLIGLLYRHLREARAAPPRAQREPDQALRLMRPAPAAVAAAASMYAATHLVQAWEAMAAVPAAPVAMPPLTSLITFSMS